jgi:hypothetical protein
MLLLLADDPSHGCQTTERVCLRIVGANQREVGLGYTTSGCWKGRSGEMEGQLADDSASFVSVGTGQTEATGLLGEDEIGGGGDRHWSTSLTTVTGMTSDQAFVISTASGSPETAASTV